MLCFSAMSASMNFSVDDLVIHMDIKPEGLNTAYEVLVTKHDVPVFENKGIVSFGSPPLGVAIGTAPSVTMFIARNTQECNKRIHLLLDHIEHYDIVKKFSMKQKCLVELCDYITANVGVYRRAMKSFEDIIIQKCNEVLITHPQEEEACRAARNILSALQDTTPTITEEEKTTIDFPSHHC